jgi:rhodanese-related sulfurtransferase
MQPHRRQFILRLLPVLLAGFASSLLAQAPAARIQDVSPDKATELIAKQKPLILDVRTPEEFADGHLAGAVNISSADPEFSKKIAALDQTRPVLVHCAAGGRSRRVLPALEALKFPSIHHLAAGFNGWLDAGKPVQK